MIGTGGRRDDAPRLTRALYDRMYEVLLAALAGPRLADVDTLVSGGAAGADHLAVRAFGAPPPPGDA